MCGEWSAVVENRSTRASASQTYPIVLRCGWPLRLTVASVPNRWSASSRERASPEDEAAFLRQLADERRLLIRLQVTRLYGTALDIGGPDESGNG